MRQYAAASDVGACSSFENSGSPAGSPKLPCIRNDVTSGGCFEPPPLLAVGEVHRPESTVRERTAAAAAAAAGRQAGYKKACTHPRQAAAFENVCRGRREREKAAACGPLHRRRRGLADPKLAIYAEVLCVAMCYTLLSFS